MPSVNAAETVTTPTSRRQEVLSLKRFGGTEGFELLAPAMPNAGAGEVRIRVLAASVQFTDLVMRQGKYPDLKQRPPVVLGYDVVGEIDELGHGVTGWKVGDRVADLTVTGSYARYRTLRVDRLVRLPQAVDAGQAATLVLSWVTAYQLLHRHAQVKKGQRVLVHGAAGAVGQALLTLGGLAGLRMWGTSRTADVDLVRSLGATPIASGERNNPTFGPGNFDAVFDGIGEGGFVRSWASLAKGGILSAYGLSSAVTTGVRLPTVGYWLARLRLWDLWPNGKAAKFYSIGALRNAHPEWYRADLGNLFQLLADHAINPLVAQRIGLGDVAEAHRKLQIGGVRGKIVICP